MQRGDGTPCDTPRTTLRGPAHMPTRVCGERALVTQSDCRQQLSWEGTAGLVETGPFTLSSSCVVCPLSGHVSDTEPAQRGALQG